MSECRSIYSSNLDSKYTKLFSRIIVFHWFYKVFLPTVFCLDVVRSHKWSHTVHRRSNTRFPLVLQGLLCMAACSRWVGGSRGTVSIRCRFARKACFPKVLRGFRVNRVLIRGGFFLATAGILCFPTFSEGFWGWLFLAR